MSAERLISGLLILGVAYGCVIVTAPFLSAMLWAGILTFATWPVLRWFRRYMGSITAALCMTLLSAVCVVVPISLIASEVVSDAPTVVTDLTNALLPSLQLPPVPQWIRKIPQFGPELTALWQKAAQDLGDLNHTLRPYAGDIAQSIAALIMQMANGGLHLAMALFIAFFFWSSGDSMGRTIQQLIVRVAGGQAERIERIIGGTVRGTVYGVIGTALIQGVLTGIGFWIVQVPEPLLFGTLASFLSVLPVGAPLVWVPAAIWLALSHHLWKGIALALYGIILISGADHVIRPFFISRGAQLPYLLTLIGVIGGVLEFGGLGIFLGPVLLAVGYTLIVEFAAGRLAYQSGYKEPQGK